MKKTMLAAFLIAPALMLARPVPVQAASLCIDQIINDVWNELGEDKDDALLFEYCDIIQTDNFDWKKYSDKKWYRHGYGICGVCETITTMQSNGDSRDTILLKLMTKYKISGRDAEKILDLF